MLSDLINSLRDNIRARSWKVRDQIKNLLKGSDHRAEIFGDIYAGGGWSGESKSGKGSSLQATEVLRRELPKLWNRHGIQSLVDAACGDFHWMQHIIGELDEYIGIDIVDDLIKENNKIHGTDNVRFECLDICVDEIPRVDAILCRDVFIHLSTRQIFQSIRNFKESGSRYLLASSGKTVDTYYDIPVGTVRRINLRIQPFSFPEPIDIIEENPKTGRQLCMWEINTLP